MVVIGACTSGWSLSFKYAVWSLIELNSGHDVAQDHWENGVGTLAGDSTELLVRLLVSARCNNVSAQSHKRLIYNWIVNGAKRLVRYTNNKFEMNNLHLLRLF